MFSIFIVGLFCFHNILVFSNTTTNEYIKKNWHTNAGNPFARNVKFFNFLNVVCRVHVPSVVMLKKNLYYNNRFYEKEENSDDHSIIDTIKHIGINKLRGEDLKHSIMNGEILDNKMRNS